MRKLILLLAVPVLLGSVLIGCDPPEEGELQQQQQQQEQEGLP